MAALPSPMIEVHVYGRLRRVADDRRATSDSIVGVPHEPGDTVRAVAERLGLREGEVGTNLFRNGRYASLDTAVEDGDRLGLFPSDMQLLYKWYFDPNAGAEHES